MQVEMTMPKIDGAMRIMAVVVDGDRYGKSRHLVSVQAPLQWVAATPRTAAPGDVMSIPVPFHFYIMCILVCVRCYLVHVHLMATVMPL